MLIAVLLIMSAVGFLFRENVQALFGPKKALTLSEYTKSREIENSVLFVGTWLINIGGMTDELYQKAIESGSEAGQTGVYYKSELAGGSWFDITGATGLADIQDSGQAVSFDEIGGLYVRYYADKYGIVTDLKTGEVINPFDIPSPYDLKEIPELQAVWVHFTQDINGEEITEEKLHMIDKAEQFLIEHGFFEERVRMHGNIARIEVPASDIPRLASDEIRSAVYEEVKKLGFLFVTLDMKGYRTGSMNATL